MLRFRPKFSFDSRHGLHPLSGSLNSVWQVGHSLGGASALIYAVQQARANQPNRIYRLVLLAPAGFHNKTPVPWVSTAPIAVPLLSSQRLDTVCAPL